MFAIRCTCQYKNVKKIIQRVWSHTYEYYNRYIGFFFIVFNKIKNNDIGEGINLCKILEFTRVDYYGAPTTAFSSNQADYYVYALWNTERPIFKYLYSWLI